MKFTPIVSTLKTVNNPNLAYKTLLYAIIAQRFSSKIKDHIRFVRDIEDEAAYKETREALIPAFITSGVLKGRKSGSADPHSLIICIDLDDLYDAVDHFKHQLSKLPYVYAIIVSLSGNGLKVFIKIDKPTDKFTHPSIYDYIAEHISKEKIIIESACAGAKALVQPCYFSLDEHPYFNPDCEAFDTSEVKTKVKTNKSVETEHADTQAIKIPESAIKEITGNWLSGKWLNNQNFKILWTGNLDTHGTPSEADLALCKHFAFRILDAHNEVIPYLCNKYKIEAGDGVEHALIDACFRQSKLYRAKWNIRQDYRESTITKAIELTRRDGGYDKFYYNKFAPQESPVQDHILEVLSNIPFTSSQIQKLTSRSKSQIDQALIKLVKKDKVLKLKSRSSKVRYSLKKSPL